MLEFTLAFETRLLFLNKKRKLKKKIFERMSGFHFPQYERESFWRYYDRLHAFIAHCGYCLEKWELLDIVYIWV